VIHRRWACGNANKQGRLYQTPILHGVSQKRPTYDQSVADYIAELWISTRFRIRPTPGHFQRIILHFQHAD
jgi:hypothetical protein